MNKITNYCLHNPFSGLIFTFLCSFFSVASGAIAKNFSYMAASQFALVYFIGNFVGSLPFCAFQNRSVLGFKESRILLCMRSICSAVGLFFIPVSTQLLPLNVAITVRSATPVIVMIGSNIFLKEKCGILQSIALVFTVTGILISAKIPLHIINNEFATETNAGFQMGIGYSIAGLFFFAAGMILLRYLKDINFGILNVHLGLWGVVICSFVIGIVDTFKKPYCTFGRYSLLLTGILGFLTPGFMTLAIKAEAAGLVAVMKSSADILIAFVIQKLFFREPIDIFDISGAILVLVSVSMIGFKKWLLTLPAESVMRKRMKLFLMC